MWTVTERESTICVTSGPDGSGLEVALLAPSLVSLHSILCSSHPRWGQYVCRGNVQGIPICSYSHAVEDVAVVRAVEIIRGMLDAVVDSVDTRLMIQTMISLGVEVAIIGHGQKTTDIPAHGHLQGRYIQNSSRTFEDDTRGLGATISCPVMSCPEENLVDIPSSRDRYPYESILVHEFAHTVMNLGLLGTELHTRIKEAYYAAMRNNLYDRRSYVASNPEEYWAEMTQAWFYATVRDDVTSGVTTREAILRHDPRLSAVLYQVWGNGSWRFYSDAHRETLSRLARNETTRRGNTSSGGQGKRTRDFHSVSCFQSLKTCTCM